MGGLACLIPWNAAVQFEAVPVKTKEKKLLEEQIRTALQSTNVANSAEERGVAAEVCELLESWPLNDTQLARLLEIAKPPY